MRKVIGIGETILDIIFKDEQPYKAVPGGSVFNGLISLGRLGVDVAFISELGNDKVGHIIKSFMVENGLTADYVDCFPDGKSPISLAFLNERSDAEYIFYKNYPAQRLNVEFPHIEADDLLIFGSFYALNPALRTRMTELLQYAKKQGAIIYYDPNFRSAHAHEAIKLTPIILENLEYADIVRGSDEDFMNIFGASDMKQLYKERIEFYCQYFLTTHGADGVNLFTPKFSEHFESRSVKCASTIGAGDNFNAGMLFGLLKYDVRKADLPRLTAEDWKKVVECGIDLSAEVCQSYDNYISKEFAEAYKNKL
jgi:fructokinase